MDNLKLTIKGHKFVQDLMGRVNNSDRFRCHNLSLTIYLSKVPRGLERNKAFCPFSNKRYSGLKAELLGCKFFYYGSNKAILYLTDLFGENRDEILDKLHSLVHQIIHVLKNEFDVEVEGFESYKLNTGHISLMGELNGVKGSFKSENFTIDCSHKTSEVEAENPDTLFEDIEKLRNFKGEINLRINQEKGGDGNG